MSKIIPMDLIKSMSGKVCSHSDMYFAKRGKTLYTGERSERSTAQRSNSSYSSRMILVCIGKA